MSHHGYTSIEALPELTGLPWNEVTQAYVSGLRPSSVAPTHGLVHTDSRPGRVTIWLDKDGMIEKVTQEVSVELPEGFRNGHDLSVALRKLKEAQP